MTSHLWYKAVLKVGRKSWEPFRIYQLTSSRAPRIFFILSAWLCIINAGLHQWDVKVDVAYVRQFFSLISDGLGGVQSLSKHNGLILLLKDHYVLAISQDISWIFILPQYECFWKKIVKKQVYETKNVLSERILKSEGAYRPTYLSWIYVIKRRRRDQHSSELNRIISKNYSAFFKRFLKVVSELILLFTCK